MGWVLDHEDLRGDRVLHLHRADPRGDRAWQLHHGGAGQDQAHGGVGTGLGSKDQGGNHRTVELPELSGGDLTPLIASDDGFAPSGKSLVVTCSGGVLQVLP